MMSLQTITLQPYGFQIRSNKNVALKKSQSQVVFPVVMSSSEPKWKQKLADADAHAEATRRQAAKVQDEYRRKLEAEQQQKLRQSAELAGIPSLDDLPIYSYLTEDGKFTEFNDPSAKASVYAIRDEEKKLRYVGVTRQVNNSLRLHFARVPLACHWVQVYNVTRPSRALLEAIRTSWIERNDTTPDGNDGGSVQNLWENPVDCKPLMTEEEKDKVENAAPGPPKGRALKQVARRIEAELETQFASRKCSEVLRFDPKLKEQGLLDLKIAAPLAKK